MCAAALEKLERPDIHADARCSQGMVMQSRSTTGGVAAIASFVQSATEHGLDCRS